MLISTFMPLVSFSLFQIFMVLSLTVKRGALVTPAPTLIATFTEELAIVKSVGKVILMTEPLPPVS